MWVNIRVDIHPHSRNSRTNNLSQNRRGSGRCRTRHLHTSGFKPCSPSQDRGIVERQPTPHGRTRHKLARLRPHLLARGPLTSLNSHGPQPLVRSSGERAARPLPFQRRSGVGRYGLTEWALLTDQLPQPVQPSILLNRYSPAPDDGLGPCFARVRKAEAAAHHGWRTAALGERSGSTSRLHQFRRSHRRRSPAALCTRDSRSSSSSTRVKSS